MAKKILFFLLAIGLSIIATFIRQFSSPDNLYKAYANINNNIYSFKLPVVRESNEVNEKFPIEIYLSDTAVKGKLFYKKLNIKEKWHENNLIRMNDNLIGVLPFQKPNIKIQYYLELKSNGKTYQVAKNNPVIFRFQGKVTKYILFPYNILMFLALIFSCYSGILSIFNLGSFIKYSKVTFYLFLFGALIFGFLVHLISFSHLFIKIATYNDLTFYKNLLIFIFWLGIYLLNKRIQLRYITFVISVITLILYCIPQNLIINIFL